jgi:hypothetical protein
MEGKIERTSGKDQDGALCGEELAMNEFHYSHRAYNYFS